MQHIAAFTISLVFIIVSPIASASDQPSSGILYGYADKDFTEYNCKPATETTIECEFTQVKVNHQTKPEDLQEKLARIPEIEKELREANKGCDKELLQTEQAIKDDKPPPGSDEAKFREGMSQLHPQQKQELLESMANMHKVCENPSRDNITAMIQHEHSKDLRTCKIFVNSYKETFERTADNIWVQNRGPEGECGIIRVSKFEKQADDKYGLLWNYKTRKIVTNKAGGAGIFKCTGFDETEYTYTWQAAEFFEGCDYVKYGF